jgi:hypothetical protein
MDSIHMFDEFLHRPDELTPELRHQKRMALEPLIFGVLQRKYGAFLQKFWNTHTVPPMTNKRIVIVERRIHPNLQFVLHNAAYYGNNWGISLICSDTNYEYCKAIVGNKESVSVIPLFQGTGTPEQGKQEYNKLLQSADFYKSFSEDNLCIVETDCYFRRKIPDWVLDYDLIGCPYSWDNLMAGGGLSFRNKNAMIRICETFPEKLPAQDVYLWEGALSLRLKLPTSEEAAKQLTESVFSKNPFGTHQWWTFFFPNDIPDADLYFRELLTLQA